MENLVYLSEKKEYFNKKIENTQKIFLELDILPLDLVKYYSISIIAELYMKIPIVKFKKNIYIILDCNEIKQYKTILIYINRTKNASKRSPKTSNQVMA